MVRLLVKWAASKPTIETSRVERRSYGPHRGGYEEIVKLLLATSKAKAHSDKYGGMPPAHAAWEGHEAVVKLLVRCRGQLERLGGPLSWASMRRHDAIMTLLQSSIVLKTEFSQVSHSLSN